MGASQRVNYAAQESKDSYFTRGNSGIALRGAPARAFDNEDEDDDDDDDENDFLRRPFNSRQPLYEHKNSENTETAGASEMDFDISAYKSQLVPIVDFFEESSAAGHAQRTVISGVSILRDPFAGHIALFRTLSMSNPRAPVGEIWAVNLTVHSTLCDLYHQLAKKQVEGEEIRRPFKDVLQSCSEQAVRWRHSQQLIATIGEGLKKMPQVIHQAHSEQLQHLSDTTEQSEVDAINGRILDKAALQVHKDILLPMSELLNVTKFHFELAQETHAAQSEVLQGSSGGAPNHSDANGIFQLLSKLKEDQSYLMERISRIKNRYAQQRENAEKFLTFAICQTNKVRFFLKDKLMLNCLSKFWLTAVSVSSFPEERFSTRNSWRSGLPRWSGWATKSMPFSACCLVERRLAPSILLPCRRRRRAPLRCPALPRPSPLSRRATTLSRCRLPRQLRPRRIVQPKWVPVPFFPRHLRSWPRGDRP